MNQYFIQDFQKSPNQITHSSDFPLRAARDRAARGNGTSIHNAPHLAARHKTAAASRGDDADRRGWQRLVIRVLHRGTQKTR